MTIDDHARASTGRQSVDAQGKELDHAGAAKVFREVGSAAKIDRAQLRRDLDQFEQGDVLLVTHLDRLARSTRSIARKIPAACPAPQRTLAWRIKRSRRWNKNP